MKYRIPVALAIVAAFIVGAWALLRPPELPEYTSPSLALTGTDVRTASLQSKLGAASVLSIDPRTRAKGATTPAPRRTLFNEFLHARNYKALYDRLRNSPEGKTPEGEYVLYEMLLRCATITDRTSRQPVARTASDQKRADFIASIPDNDPQRDKRIAAFDDVTANRCAGMELSLIHI